MTFNKLDLSLQFGNFDNVAEHRALLSRAESPNGFNTPWLWMLK